MFSYTKSIESLQNANENKIFKMFNNQTIDPRLNSNEKKCEIHSGSLNLQCFLVFTHFFCCAQCSWFFCISNEPVYLYQKMSWISDQTKNNKRKTKWKKGEQKCADYNNHEHWTWLVTMTIYIFFFIRKRHSKRFVVVVHAFLIHLNTGR